MNILFFFFCFFFVRRFLRFQNRKIRWFKNLNFCGSEVVEGVDVGPAKATPLL